ncbi:MAG: hypothetical protein BWY92_00340 [Firmicutes bacterium ADurb.BinA052]|nr:hypothetical protein [Bacillota bacterium]OPZ51191.1 MAG: hypothetical protein BWY92_00340 [Firmicutes bacterium ADurb.BinA052]
MRRPIFCAVPFAVALLICFVASPAPHTVAATDGYDVVSAEPVMHAGMHLIFDRTAAGASTGSKWHVTVQSASYPKWAEISWVWPRSDGTLPAATIRRINGLERGRTFGPVFGVMDPIDTDNTAPWVSREVLRELRTGKVAYNFKMGNVSLTGILAGDLRVDEEVLFPVDLNGRRVFLPAYKCAKGQLIIWNNMQNPLVLEYRPIGVPLITGVFGWKAESISIGGEV